MVCLVVGLLFIVSNELLALCYGYFEYAANSCLAHTHPRAGGRAMKITLRGAGLCIMFCAAYNLINNFILAIDKRLNFQIKIMKILSIQKSIQI